MSNKVLKIALKAESRVIVSTILFVVGSIISLLLSISISPYFYFLSIPLLALTVYLISLCYDQVINKYNYELKKEENLDDGHYKTYFKNKKDQVEFEFNILKGKRHGSYIEYYISGQQKRIANYKIGEFDGSYRTYYENGELKSETNYSNGVQFGETKSYYNNGKIYRTFNLSNGVYDGEIKEFHKNGDIKFICNNEKYTFYKKNNIACEIEYDGNQPKGIWKNYRYDGTIEYELDFNIKKDNKVLKTVYTKGGEVYSNNDFDYEINKDLKYNIMGNHKHFNNFSPWQRLEYGKISFDTGFRGPPGISSRTVNIYPIESIEDIVELS